MQNSTAAPGRRRRAPRNPQPLYPEPREGFTALGVVARAHGIRGEIRVSAFNPAAPNLQRGRRVYLKAQRFTILRARPDREGWILQLGGLDNRNSAEGLSGELIEAADADVRRDDADSHFLHELVGLRVVTLDGRELGAITEVLQTGANDVYVARGPRGEVLIPAIGEVIDSIDIASGVIRITPLAGMLDESQ